MNRFTTSRTFNAGRDLVFSCWTKPVIFEQWHAPEGCEMKLLHADARAGGYYLQSDKWPDAHFYMKHVFHEVTTDARLAYVTSFCTEDGEIIRHPLNASWPERMLTTISLEEDGAGTKVTAAWEPVEPSAEEAAHFAAMLPKCEVGWNSTFDRLEKTITDLTKGA